MIDPRIYLASRSPRRRELLTQIGVRFDLLLFRMPPREDDDVSEAWLPGEQPEAYVQRVARAKAMFAKGLIASRAILPHPVLMARSSASLRMRPMRRRFWRDFRVAVIVC
jgi:septum formation protein